MAITISIDNNRSTVALDDVTHDENSGVQTRSHHDTGDEVDITLSNPVDGTIAGLTTVMNGLLNAATLFGFASFKLSDAQKAYLAAVDGASSSLDFVKVTVTEGETIDDLFFSDADGNDLNGDLVVGMKTLTGRVCIYGRAGISQSQQPALRKEQAASSPSSACKRMPIP